jgi:hypothetical protein
MRIRTIKPEFFIHEELFELEKKSGLPVRLAFIGLWCAADREGRFKWQPRALGAQILPYDGADFGGILDALESGGFVVRYGGFGWIPGFLRHQQVNHRAPASQLPAPPDHEDGMSRGAPVHTSHDSPVTSGHDEHGCPVTAVHGEHGVTIMHGHALGDREGKGREREREGEGSVLSHDLPLGAVALVSENDSSSDVQSASRKKKGGPVPQAEVVTFCVSQGLPESDGVGLYAKWEANGWCQGGVRMKDWRGTVTQLKVRGYLDSQKRGGQTWGVGQPEAKKEAPKNEAQESALARVREQWPEYRLWSEVPTRIQLAAIAAIDGRAV